SLACSGRLLLDPHFNMPAGSHDLPRSPRGQSSALRGTRVRAPPSAACTQRDAPHDCRLFIVSADVVDAELRVCAVAPVCGLILMVADTHVPQCASAVLLPAELGAT